MSTEMRLIRFRVQNYKSVNDSGWVNVDTAVTALVGKNESGKSALLRALYKLNPVASDPFNPVREFPRGRYTYEFKQQDWVVISAEFAIPTLVQEEIAAAVGDDWRPATLILSQKYSNTRSYEFAPAYAKPLATGATLGEWLTSARRRIQRTTSKDVPTPESLQQLKRQLGDRLEMWIQRAEQVSSLRTDVGRALLREIAAGFAETLAEDWQRPIVEPLMDELEPIQAQANSPDPSNVAWQLVQPHLPVFIYFEDYSVLDDTLVIDRFISDYNRDKTNPRLRTKMALFQHVNLSPEEVLTLGRENPEEQEAIIRDRKDERAIKLASASRAMTEKFQGWWGQRRHEFDYRVDGNYFRVWVSDDKNPDPIELVNRSRGLQWFFSFYLVFLVEAEEGHRNAILLLDEPGLSLHPTAQQDLLNYLERLAGQNQLIYSTHSPFMVDGNHLERVRVVSENDRGQTEVSDRIWPKDREATFPLQAALGYSLAQTLFQGKRSLIVEGLTDLWILKALDATLKGLGRTGLFDDVVITPAGGAKEIAHFASLYLANDVGVVTLYDSDGAGQRYAKEVIQGLFAGSANQVLLISDAAGVTGIELEDLIPRPLYITATAAAHQDIIGSSNPIQFDANEAGMARVTDALEVYARRLGLVSPTGARTVFDKGRTTWKLLEAWQQTPLEQLDATLLKNFEHLFSLINAAFAGVSK